MDGRPSDGDPAIGGRIPLWDVGNRPAEVLLTRPPGVVTTAERALGPVGTEGRAVADGRRIGVELCLVIAGRGAVIVLRGAALFITDVRGMTVGAGRADGVL
ncbi:MAG: hypothetical protein JXA69_09115 [Phycisphaerae bacterium]|nr:hypothetical protein [Phycisphaerae bacterium]